MLSVQFPPASFFAWSLKMELLGEFCVRKVKVLNLKGYQLQLAGSPVGGSLSGVE